MNNKPWYQSKTMWFNVLLGVLQLLDSTGVLQAVPDQVLGGAGAVGNILLRFATKKPIIGG